MKHRNSIAVAVAAALCAPLAALAQPGEIDLGQSHRYSYAGAQIAQATPAPAPRTGGSQTGTATRTRASDDSRSFLPGTNRGYIGVNLARPDFDDLACTPGFACDDPDVAFKVYTGGLWSDVIGGEVGYIYFGEASRAGGDANAHGVNLSVVANIPFHQQFSAFAKIGTTYAWTERTAVAGTGVRVGDENDFGISYGFGVGFGLTPNVQLVGEWERHNVKFASGDSDIDLLSIGARYRF